MLLDAKMEAQQTLDRCHKLFAQDDGVEHDGAEAPRPEIVEKHGGGARYIGLATCGGQWATARRISLEATLCHGVHRMLPKAARLPLDSRPLLKATCCSIS